MKNHIEKWLKEGLISKQQSEKMIADIESNSSEKSSRKIIYSLSILGAVLVGIGSILFIASNWQLIPSILKIALMSVLTFVCAFTGYYLEYVNKNYPKTGHSLLFLSTLLVGALILLISQIYHVNLYDGLASLVLIWLLFVIPFIYIFSSRPVAALVSVLSILWFSLFIFDNNNFSYVEFLLPVLYCLFGILLFSFGKINEFFKGLEKISAVFRKFGIFIILLCTFLLTFSIFSNAKADSYFYDFVTTWKVFPLRFVYFLIIPSVLTLLAALFFNPSKRNNLFETILLFTVLILCLFNMSDLVISRLAINIIYALLLLLTIIAGYQKRELFYVNLGIFWIIIFIAVKYFDVFWNLLPRAAFFICGGIILVATALFLENKRKNIKAEIKANEA